MEKYKYKVTYETTDFENTFQIVYKTTTRRGQYGTHIHTRFYEIHLLLRGNIVAEIEGITKPLMHGDITIISPEEIHQILVKDNSEYERIVFHISESLLKELSTARCNFSHMFQHKKTHFTHFSDAELKEYIKTTQKINEYSNDPEIWRKDILLRSYLNILLVQLLSRIQEETGEDQEQYKRFPPEVDNAISYIKEHLTEDISVVSIANHLNISRSYISRIFKKYTGYTLWHYVIFQRLILSQKLILNGRSITEACYDSGFRNYAHFIKTFAKAFHMPPKKFKDQENPQMTLDFPANGD